MTLDEAIKHTKDVAEKFEKNLKVYENINEDRPLFIEEETECRLCAEEHRQLAEWLKDYKRLKKQEPCDDAISRQEVLDEINRIGIKAFETYNNYSELYDFVDGLPPVTPQKTGHWITHDESITLLTGETATGGVICSECGYKTHNKAHVIVKCPYKYCPDCSARMVESQANE